MLGVLNLEFAIGFTLAAVGLSALLSTAAAFLEKICLGRYPRWRDLIKLTAHSVLENFGYRQVNIIWRIITIVFFLRKNQFWGAMKCKGFAEKASGLKRAAISPNPREETILR